MKKLCFLFIIFLLTSCSNTNSVYWCGDHQCINKKEIEAYFKKTMIVEIRDLNKEKNKKDSKMNQILNQATLDEKKRIINEKDFTEESNIELEKRVEKEKLMKRQAKFEEKRRIEEEKKMKKQAKLEEKRRIEEEKKMKKQAKLDEKIRAKKEKELEKKVEKDEKNIIEEKQIKNTEFAKQKNAEDSLSFGNIVEEIFIRDSLKPYPDINGIQY